MDLLQTLRNAYNQPELCKQYLLIGIKLFEALQLLERLGNGKDSDNVRLTQYQSLTKQERLIFKRIGEGENVKVIAEKLGPIPKNNRISSRYDPQKIWTFQFGRIDENCCGAKTLFPTELVPLLGDA